MTLSMSMIQMIIIIMISRVILQRDNVRHAHTVKIWHTKKSNSQLFSIRFWFNQSIPVTVKHLLIIISPRPTWMILFSTTCWKEQGMTLLMSMIQMINYNYDQEGDTAKIQCENELYPLLLENDENARHWIKGLQLSFVLAEISIWCMHESRKACHQVSCCPCNICSIWAYLESSSKSPHCQEK